MADVAPGIRWFGVVPHQNRSGRIRHQSDTVCHAVTSQARAEPKDFDGPLGCRPRMLT